MILAFLGASLVQILSRSYISAMHLFICFFVTDFVRKNFVTWVIPSGQTDNMAQAKRVCMCHNIVSRFAITFPNKPLFLCVCSTRLLKTPVTSNFSFFHSVFYPFGKLSAIFIKFKIVCKFFQFGKPKICCLGKGYDRNLYRRTSSTIAYC